MLDSGDAGRDESPGMSDTIRRWSPDLSTRREALRGCGLFRFLTAEELEAVLARATLQRFDRGDTLMRRGDPATGMLVILQGRVRISITSAEGRPSGWPANCMLRLTCRSFR